MWVESRRPHLRSVRRDSGARIHPEEICKHVVDACRELGWVRLSPYLISHQILLVLVLAIAMPLLPLLPAPDPPPMSSGLLPRSSCLVAANEAELLLPRRLWAGPAAHEALDAREPVAVVAATRVDCLGVYEHAVCNVPSTYACVDLWSVEP